MCNTTDLIQERDAITKSWYAHCDVMDKEDLLPTVLKTASTFETYPDGNIRGCGGDGDFYYDVQRGILSITTRTKNEKLLRKKEYVDNRKRMDYFLKMNPITESSVYFNYPFFRPYHLTLAMKEFILKNAEEAKKIEQAKVV